MFYLFARQSDVCCVSAESLQQI